MRDPFTKWLWDARRSLAAWTATIAAVGGMYAAFWPTIDDPAMQDAISNYPQGLLDALNYGDIGTAPGYVSATVYGLVVAVLVAVYSIGAGTGIVAGDEEARTLELVLAHPIGRRRLVLRRFAGFAVSVVVIAVTLMLVLQVLRRPARLDGVDLAGSLAVTAHLVAFGCVHGAVAFAAGAATGRRAAATGAGAGVAVLGFAANGVLPQVEGFGWSRRVSPFNWLIGGTPLRDGPQWGHLLTMVVVVVVLVAAGTLAFDRRDVAR